MSQEEVLKILEENDMTRNEIERQYQANKKSLIRALHALIKYQEIMIKEYRNNIIPVYGIKKEKGAKCPKNKK